MKKIYNKLVRDRIPEIIRGAGKEPVTRVLDEKEYLHELIKKLKEEVAEFESEKNTFDKAGNQKRESNQINQRDQQEHECCFEGIFFLID